MTGAERDGRAPSRLELAGIRKSLGGIPVLRGIDLTVEGGEIVSLLGPSGCGKTTTLNIVAGFLEPDAGEVRIDGLSVTRLPPYRRDLALVFQNYSLFPHMTAFDNVAFGLRMRKVPKGELRDGVREALELVHLRDVDDRYPRQLSGGQQQRVGLARALAVRPRVLLLDEPLSNLDAKLRKTMQMELLRIQQQVRITTIYVTHDQEEALALSDRVAVMNAGVIEQSAPPELIYSQPASEFVGEFIGESSPFSAQVADASPGRVALDVAGGHRVWARTRRHFAVGQAVRVLVRPDRVTLEPAGPGDEDGLPGRVVARAFAGAFVRCLVELDGDRPLLVHLRPDAAARVKIGDRVRARVAEEDWLVLPAAEEGHVESRRD